LLQYKAVAPPHNSIRIAGLGGGLVHDYPMFMSTPPSSRLSEEERLRLGQEAYERYGTRCFWFMKRDLQITRDDLPFIIEGLKLNGGHEGWKLAHDLCR